MTARATDPQETVASGAPRTGLRLVRDPVFGGLFWGKLLSGAGVYVHGVVAAIVVFDATRSAFAVGLVSIAQFAPQLLLSPLSGTFADRGHAWLQMVMGRVLCTLGSGGLALWMLLVGTTDGWAGAWPVFGASVVVGLGFVLGGPAQQSVIPRIVTADELPTAMTLNTAPMTFARVVGPALGAIVAARLGPGEAFAVAAGGHLLFTLILLLIRLPVDDPHDPDTDYSVRAAVRYVRQKRSLFLVLLAVTAAGVGSEPTITLAPALAHDLGGGESLVGALTSTFGIGAMIGLVSVGVMRRRSSLVVASSVGLGLMAAGMAVVAAVPWTASALAGFGLAGLGFSWSMASLGTLAQTQAPPLLRGRIMALWMMGFIGSRPLAASVLGGIADASSVRVAVTVMAALLLVATLTCRPRRLLSL